jgi:hypothetical protein
VRRLAPFAAALLALAFVAAASARDPRAEKLQLNARDNRAARAALITAADLRSDWQRIATSNDETVPSCPGYRPDFSRFTITGKADAEYKTDAGEVLTSHVEVYKSHADATGDYQLGAKAQVASCLGATLAKAPTGDPSVHLKVVSAKQVGAPRIGERTARYRIVLRVTGPSGSVPLYVDAIVFQKGRTLALLMTMGVSQPITDGPTLARRMYSRSVS